MADKPPETPHDADELHGKSPSNGHRGGTPDADRHAVTSPGSGEPAHSLPIDTALNGDRPPADANERQRISVIRSRNLFVDAGAGTGKTRSLVDRVEALVFDDGIAMESIAAITFTEKAATELQNRIRRRFEQRLAETVKDRGPHSQAGDADTSRAIDQPDAAETARNALDQLDSAAVGTLHSFAQRILGEHLLAAELPPGIEVLDEIGSQIDFEGRWGEFLDDLIESPAARRSLLVLDVVGVKADKLRKLALQMAANWDLVQARLDLNPPKPTPFDPQPLIDEFDRVLTMRQRCENPDGEKLLPHFDKLASNRQRLAAADDDIEVLLLASDMGEEGSQGIKPGISGKGEEMVGIRKLLRGLCGSCDEAVGKATGAALNHVGGFLGRFVLDSAEQRRAGGKLEFHDLLVRARRLLRHPEHGPPVRKALHERYRRLLLDEFQDTDPIQIELAMLIASSPAADTGDADHLSGRQRTGPEPGRLFVVGDPKQSIYRFRRADIKTYLETRERFGEDDRVDLTVNFRSTRPVIDWVNTVFSELIQRDDEHGQPAYVPLSAHRTQTPPAGPAVALLGVDPIEGNLNAEQLREIEAEQVAAAVAEILCGAEPWSVYDRESEQWRPAVEDDVCILLPARTSLAALERALTDEGVPYRAETATLVYGAREVRELMLALEAVADPTNELATVAALRSFVYGCGDDDLAHWRHGAGNFPKRGFSLRAPIPEHMAGHPVADGLAHLKKLHHERLWSGPAELLDRLIRERAVLESAVAYRDPRAVWRRLRFVVDQARAWSDAGGADLRAYLRWARLQGAENARLSETVLPESDDRSVRIMTVHGAKGLEFPITVLSGMTTEVRGPQGGPAVIFPRDSSQVLLRASAQATSEGYDEWKPIDEQMDAHERIRLLYVAATRARDHLIVSLVRKAKANAESPSPRRTSASELAKAALDADDIFDAGSGFCPFPPAVAWQPAPPPHEDRPQAVPAERQPQPDRSEWLAERDHALRAACAPRVISASALAGRARRADDQPEQAEHGDRIRLADHGQPGQTSLFDQAERPLRDAPNGRTDHVAQPAPAEHGRPSPGTETDAQGNRDGPPARTSEDPGLAKEPRDLDLPPWRKGRYGTAVGRAVHGVLQVVDLASGDGLHEIASAQAMAEGIGDQDRLVADLARQALRSPVTREASQAEHWREIWVAAPLEDAACDWASSSPRASPSAAGRSGAEDSGPQPSVAPEGPANRQDGLLLEGYVDLLYRKPSGGLVVVDWKTDQADDLAGLEAKAEQRYRLQGASYALAVEAATGETVHEMVFVFLSDRRCDAIEVPLRDLRSAIHEVRERAAELAEASAAVEPARELA